MAFILNSKGEILEGTPLTIEEAKLIPAVQQLLEVASTSYLPASNSKKMVLALFEKYEMRERKQPEPELSEIVQPLAAHIDQIDEYPTTSNLAIAEEIPL